MTKRLLLLLSFGIVLQISSNCFAQAPKWKSGYFKELGNSYIETASGTANSVEAARNNAASEIIRKRDMATGASAQVVNGQVTTSGSLLVKSRVIDEYIETLPGGNYRVYLLTQTAKHPDNNYEPVNITDEYPFSARCLVPGMQQFYKGQTAKGIAFIGAEALSIGGIIISESMRADYVNKASIANNTQSITDNTDNANTMQTKRNIFIGAAAVVYIWNIVDAIVSKGGRHVVLANAQLTPYASSDSFGLALNYKF